MRRSFIIILSFILFIVALINCEINTCDASDGSCTMYATADSLKIMLILGSTREGRFGDRVGKFVSKKLKDAKHEVTILDPLDLNLPVLKQPLHFYPDPNQAPKELHEINDKIKSVDAYIVITPEYNRQLPPALTNLIDYFPPRSFAYKSSAIVTYSLGAGGANAAGQARTLMVELGAPPIPYILQLTEVAKKIDEAGEPTDEYLHKQIDKLLIQLNFYAMALKKHRALVGEPQWGTAMSL